MLEMMILAEEPREVCGERIDEILIVLGAPAHVEIVDIGIETGQPQGAHDLGEPRDDEGSLGVGKRYPGYRVNPFADAREFPFAQAKLAIVHAFPTP